MVVEESRKADVSWAVGGCEDCVLEAFVCAGAGFNAKGSTARMVRNE